MKTGRRDFIAGGAAALLAGALPPWAAWAEEAAKHPLAGKPMPPWSKGRFRITVHYTGRSESTHLVFPDSTSALIDCGEFVFSSPDAVEHLPEGLSAGEAICRRVLRDNPNGRKVDYFILSHYHSDHAGSIKCPVSVWPRTADGSRTLCGFGRAIDMLDFGKIIDRSWPDMNDPVPRSDRFDDGVCRHVRETYMEAERRGVKIERFLLEKGSRQISLLHGGCDRFGFTPLCARGLVLRRDGTVLDLGTLSGKPGKGRAGFAENPLSTGMVFSLGDFRYYTAGDFETPAFEDALAAECPAVDVAKANHHGHHTMSEKLVSALDASVYLCGGFWHRQHMNRPTMRRIAAASKRPYLVAPGYFPDTRRKADAAEPWLARVAPEAFKPCHTVVDVAPDGASYTVAMVDASVEDGAVLGAYDFKTVPKT